MFEKESEEWVKKNMDCCKTDNSVNQSIPYFDEEERCIAKSAFQDGAEFGYNKANEWHCVNWKYFADIDYPKSESALYLVQLRNKDTLICEWETEEGFGYFYDSNLEPIDNDDVYAWKEIVLPRY